MPKIIVTQPFKFAHHGYQVEEFEPSYAPRDTSDECAELACAEGWATLADEPTPEVPPQAPAGAHDTPPEPQDAVQASAQQGDHDGAAADAQQPATRSAITRQRKAHAGAPEVADAP